MFAEKEFEDRSIDLTPYSCF